MDIASVIRQEMECFYSENFNELNLRISNFEKSIPITKCLDSDFLIKGDHFMSHSSNDEVIIERPRPFSLDQVSDQPGQVL